MFKFQGPHDSDGPHPSRPELTGPGPTSRARSDESGPWPGPPSREPPGLRLAGALSIYQSEEKQQLETTDSLRLSDEPFLVPVVASN